MCSYREAEKRAGPTSFQAQCACGTHCLNEHGLSVHLGKRLRPTCGRVTPFGGASSVGAPTLLPASAAGAGAVTAAGASRSSTSANGIVSKRVQTGNGAGAAVVSGPGSPASKRRKPLGKGSQKPTSAPKRAKTKAKAKAMAKKPKSKLQPKPPASVPLSTSGIRTAVKRHKASAGSGTMGSVMRRGSVLDDEADVDVDEDEMAMLVPPPLERVDLTKL